ncbi:MAG: DUF4349 domain-containing protein [Bacteroidetes bacterium]|nr:DUF4349 domain-containing protein [Bacteroidota bacterium]
MKNFISPTICSFLILLTFSCGPKGPNPEEIEASKAFESTIVQKAEIHEDEVVSNSKSTNEIARKILKTGEISFVCENLSVTTNNIKDICVKFKAYVSKESERSGLSKELELKIPSDKYDLFVDSLSSIAINLESKNLNEVDVTEEFLDVEARIKTKSDLEARYRELIKQAKTIEEILKIEERAEVLRGEIESMQGRLNFLKNQTSYGTLTVRFHVKSSTLTTSIVNEIKDAFDGGWKIIKYLFIGLIYLWPFILVALVWYFIKKKHAK